MKLDLLLKSQKTKTIEDVKDYISATERRYY